MHAVFLMIQYLGIVILMLEAFYIAGQKSSRQQQEFVRIHSLVTAHSAFSTKLKS